MACAHTHVERDKVALAESQRDSYSECAAVPLLSVHLSPGPTAQGRFLGPQAQTKANLQRSPGLSPPSCDLHKPLLPQMRARTQRHWERWATATLARISRLCFGTQQNHAAAWLPGVQRPAALSCLGSKHSQRNGGSQLFVPKGGTTPPDLVLCFSESGTEVDMEFGPGSLPLVQPWRVREMGYEAGRTAWVQ